MSAHQPKPPSETLGQRVRRLREERGLSQRQLSGPGLSNAYVSRIEADQRAPSIKAIRMIATRLGVSPTYLETGQELDESDVLEMRLSEVELDLRLSPDTSKVAAELHQIRFQARRGGDSHSLARAEIALGLLAEKEGRYSDVVTHLERATTSGHTHPVARPDVYTALGVAYRELGRFGDAVRLFQSCLDALDQHATGEAVRSARTRFITHLSYVLSNLGEFGRARDLLSRLAEALDDDDENDPYARVRLHWSVARLASMEGKPSLALDSLRQAIALLQTTEDTLGLGRSHLLCAQVLVLDEQPAEAQRHLEIAERLMRDNGDRAELGVLLCERAKTAAQLGNGEEAIALAEEASVLIRDNPHQLGGLWHALAAGHALTGALPIAIDYYDQAVAQLETNGEWREALQACRAWAKALEQDGRITEALEIAWRVQRLEAQRQRAEAGSASTSSGSGAARR